MEFFGTNTHFRQYVIAISLFFFLNVYLLYNTVQHTELKKKSGENAIASAKNAEYFVSPVMTCDITDELAKSAVSRAVSFSCQAKLQFEACLLKNGTFTEIFPTSQCSNHDNSLIDREIGCFYDSKESRVLKEFEYSFPEANSKATCRKHCYKAGFLYYGLEFEKECFCGNDLINSTKIDDMECKKYKCPGAASKEFCGGFNAIDIFRTGFKSTVSLLKPKYVPPGEPLENPAKILFLLQLNGRNERQVKRFLKSIYLPHHYYYIHVDKRQHYMYSEMLNVEKKVKNIHVSNRRFNTIWGGASLLQMFQQVIRDTLELEKFNDWDYIINFSESDFPILPIEDFERLITVNKGKSFLASHGYCTGKFIRKQGFEYVFSECDNRMFRIGKREFPENLRIDGGSDWVGIHRSLAEYSISDDELPRKLRKTYESILLPLESFYHTLSLNSKFCDDLLMSNLRLTNWYRKQGCRCESLKPIVDWCGCSPLVFREETRRKFEREKAISKTTYFARKFDSMIDIESIEEAEKQSISPEKIQLEHPRYHFAVANIFKHGIDEVKIHFESFAKYLLKSTGNYNEKLQTVIRIDALRSSNDAKIEIIMKVETRNGEVFEFLINRISHVTFSAKEDMEVHGYQLKDINYGTKYEWKEEICREYMGFVTDNDILHTRLQWHATEKVKKNGDKTSPEMKFKYRNGDEFLDEKIVKSYDSVFGGQFDSWNVAKKLANLTTCDRFYVDVFSPLSPESPPLASLRFPVYTIQNVACHQEYFQDFFKIVDFCSSAKECEEKIWSSSYPDPKSDILTGYNPKTKNLE